MGNRIKVTVTDIETTEGPAYIGHYHGQFCDIHRPRVFCGSHVDVFDVAVNQKWASDLFKLVAKTPHIDWLIPTKRIGDAREVIYSEFGDGDVPLNMWIGVKISNQKEAEQDVPYLMNISSTKRFIMIDRLRGEIDLRNIKLNSECMYDATKECDVGYRVWQPIDFVIVNKYQAKHSAWVWKLHEQCVTADIPFFKRLGSLEFA